MDRLSEMEAFVSVVDQGGFTDAARKMGMSKSAVSKHVSALEARLGARLLNRTTRRVSPTEIGLAYYDRASQVLSSASEADEMVNAMQDAPRGALRVSVPVSFGISQISARVGSFLCEYPDISLNLVLDDRFVELVSEGFDMAIRVGHLEDSTLRARKLAESRIVMAASPDYLRKRGKPEKLEELSDHQLLHYSNLATGNFWRLQTKSGEERHVRVGGRLTANNGESLLKAAESGLGVALLPAFIIGDSLQKGRLLEVLPDNQNPPLGIYAVYPPGRFVQPKLRAFIDFLVQSFKGMGPDDWQT
ncbi:LysR family transcriptional regulator [Algicella marina]|uniref:LysR family transcriptional regulator n=1 Tax=Algicella marina TaxID=2683284 RepID=A0A6P1T5Y7_9RHOB|nr:LysR family transcriptional regulator [Algicella marina]QHQ36876.1 LysR family transcriptional regulator [Algicella marina]